MIHRVSVYASILAAAVPKRDELPELRTPPKGTCASSRSVWSLMCEVPVGMRSANASPVATSAVKMPNARPYSVSEASSTASSSVEKRVTQATGPNTSWS